MMHATILEPVIIEEIRDYTCLPHRDAAPGVAGRGYWICGTRTVKTGRAITGEGEIVALTACGAASISGLPAGTKVVFEHGVWTRDLVALYDLCHEEADIMFGSEQQHVRVLEHLDDGGLLFLYQHDGRVVAGACSACSIVSV